MFEGRLKYALRRKAKTGWDCPCGCGANILILLATIGRPSAPQRNGVSFITVMKSDADLAGGVCCRALAVATKTVVAADEINGTIVTVATPLRRCNAIAHVARRDGQDNCQRDM